MPAAAHKHPKAEVLKGYQPNRLLGRKPTYPWDLWFNGQTYRITQGVHFSGKVEHMQKLIRRTANAHGKQMSVFVDDKTSIIIFPAQRNLPCTDVNSASPSSPPSSLLSSSLPRLKPPTPLKRFAGGAT